MLKVSKITFLAYGVLCIAVIAALLMPRLTVKYDAAAHIAVYALLAIWPVMVVGSIKKTAMVFLGLVLISALVEFLQRYSPERTASWGDLGMNVIGIFVGLIMALLLKWKYQPAQA